MFCMPISFGLLKGGAAPPATPSYVYTYDGTSFTVTQDTLASGIFVKADGSKLYISGDTNNRIYQYSFGVAWDLTTLTYDGVNYSFATQTTSVSGVLFSTDGTKMYIIPVNPRVIYQYTLGTPWVVSSASYASKSFDFSLQVSSGRQGFFNSDGTKIYISDSSTDRIYQYTLSTAWDISTASYDSVNISLGGYDSSLQGAAINNDGTRLFFVGNTIDKITQLLMSTPWDLSTASFENDVTAEDTNLSQAAISMSSDDWYFYMLSNGSDKIYRYASS